MVCVQIWRQGPRIHMFMAFFLVVNNLCLLILKCLESENSFSFTFDEEQDFQKKSSRLLEEMSWHFAFCSECTSLQDYGDIMAALLSNTGTEMIEEKCKYVH